MSSICSTLIYLNLCFELVISPRIQWLHSLNNKSSYGRLQSCIVFSVIGNFNTPSILDLFTFKNGSLADCSHPLGSSSLRFSKHIFF